METSSQDVLKEIANVVDGLDEGEETVESITDEWSRTNNAVGPAYEPPDPDEETADFYESRANLEQQWRASETERMKNEFARTGVVPQAMNFDEWQTHREIVEPQQKIAVALQNDLEDLVQRYPKSSAGFLKKLRRGEIQMPEGLEAEDNALEAWFINSLSQDEFRRLDTDAQMELFAKEGEERKPLRTRSLDIAQPKRVKPKPQPTARRQPTYKLPDLTQDEMREALNWAIQKKMRGVK